MKAQAFSLALPKRHRVDLMRTQEIDFDAQPPIDSFGAGGFRIKGGFHSGHLLMSPAGRGVWNVEPDAMTLSHFAGLLAQSGAIDVVLVGMGGEIAPVPGEVREAFDVAGIGIEAMSTSSACRTYNVLLGEDRRVAVALIAV
jgi:uncharacterized protein